MKFRINFNEAFEEQLKTQTVLTEGNIKQLKEKVCYISKEKFVPGDTVLQVVIPESMKGNTTFVHLATVKKSVLEKKNWTYFPRHEAVIPCATEESVLGVKRKI